ncbi:hypothetical protein MRX96_027883 [Rhipicephalus microplus]
MAASGCLDGERNEELGLGGVRKASFLDMIRPERIYHQRAGDLDYAAVRSSAGPGCSGGTGGLAKCLVERISGAPQSVLVNNKVVVGAAASSRGPASSTARRDGYDGEQDPTEFAAEQRRNHRYDRAASTDSHFTVLRMGRWLPLGDMSRGTGDLAPKQATLVRSISGPDETW